MSPPERALHPDQSALHRFGYELRRWRKLRGLSQSSLGKHAHVSGALIQRIEVGQRNPSHDLATRCDAALNAGGAILDAWAAIEADAQKAAGHADTGHVVNDNRPVMTTGLGIADPFTGWPGDGLDTMQLLQAALRTGITPGENESEEDMERRRLLQGLAALGLAVSPATQALESVRKTISSTLAGNDQVSLDDWDDSLMEYGYSYLSTPPRLMVPTLAADLLTVCSVVAGLEGRDSESRRWSRIGGTLSALMAKALSNLGLARDSREWWNTARHAADASGDLDLSLWVRGNQINRGLYENRPPQALVKRADAALEHAGGHICAGLAEMSGTRAQALVLIGDHQSAERELHRTEGILAKLPANVVSDTSSVFGWGEVRLRYTQAWVHAHVGNGEKADQAARLALQLYPPADARSPAQIQLIQGLARIQGGDITEGIRHATAVYGALGRGQRTTMIGTLAAQVLERVPAEERDRTDVAEYHALLAS